MKKLLFSALLLASLGATAQEATEIPSAAKGVTYGAALSKADAVPMDQLEAKLTNGSFEGKIQGKVKEVCQTMGCWMKVEKADGSTMMVKMKDHSFFLPKNIVGHTVQMDGVAQVKTETEAKRKHYAEDAGKSKAEIAKIKGDKSELQFTASGLVVID
ncbi:DUF4920 domain-containing protein [Flaviaesturariibacter amylovorans]|uniref:DUF4920 domain-containing protein n=1 Tax=Flaviaesturariibacter amylovorans TaxID=1084520 RepID=A0ABP8HTR4_9BACT